MSILDEIARRRRASALRRLGPPPGALPEHFPMPARKVSASLQRRAPQRTSAVAVVEPGPVAPTATPTTPAEPERAPTLESVLPHVLASISSLPARREVAPASDPVPLLQRRAPVETVAPPAPASDPDLDDSEEFAEVDAEIHIPDAEPVEDGELEPDEPAGPAARGDAPEAPFEVSTWTQVADDCVDEPRPDTPAPLEPESHSERARQPVPEPARSDAPRYDAWLPTPDLFKLTGEPVTGELEPITATDLKPLTSTELVPVSQPGTDRQLQPAQNPPSFVERTQLRRRIRFLRQLREVQLRDLGGFALELHRFGRDKPELVASKIEAAAETDRELRQLEYALNGRVELRVVREAGIGGACSQCGAVYGTEDRFCSNCGEPLPGTTLLRDDRPARPDRPTR